MINILFPLDDVPGGIAILSNADLLKQCKDVHKLIQILENKSDYINEDYVFLWGNYLEFLKEYCNLCIFFLKERKIATLYDYKYISNGEYNSPEWIYNQELHSNHRAYLLHHDSKYYSNFYWNELPSEVFTQCPFNIV